MKADDSADARAWEQRAHAVARGIRRRVLEHTIRSQGGYLSQACSSAEILATLYTKVMRLGPAEAPSIPAPFMGVPGPHNRLYTTGYAYNGAHRPDLDRFYLSPSHYGLVLYATLIEVGRLDPAGLDQFNRDGSTVEMIAAEHSPGAELTSGSLGQTLSQVAGIALARRRRGETGRSWVFMSDGEFQSGQTWEALQALAFLGLDSIGVYVDVNGQQCDGAMETTMRIEPLNSRLAAFGMQVAVVNGHDLRQLAAAADTPHDGKPLIVLCYTNPCQGIPLMEQRRPKLHYVRFANPDERLTFQSALESL